MLLHFLTVLIYSIDIVSTSNNSAVIGGTIGIIIAILVTITVIVLLILFFMWKRNHNDVIELK